ncbi:MAG: hypothetical protein IJE53_03005 [Bacilli bacterium]|nr:hypothetical protein [Bacilli bacterium]
MKKKIIIFLSLLVMFMTGCGNNSMTPTAKVEEFLGRYQSMDSEVLTQLDNVIANDTSMNDTQKKDYKTLMEKQYQNLSYKIKDEEIDGDEAEVLVEIEVYDYANSIVESREYYTEHRDEFDDEKIGNDGADTDNDGKDEEGEIVGGAVDTISSFITYKIKQLMDVTDKAKYEITFHLTKEDGEWVIEDLTDVDRQKIHGLFED